MKVMILLHGLLHPEGEFALVQALPESLKLAELAARRNLMIVIPCMLNHYYISTSGYDCGRFAARELPQEIRERFRLPEETEFILAGISMGGYGAVLIASREDVFSACISVSGSFVADDILIGNPQVWGDRLPTEASAGGSYLQYFLPLRDLEESRERNAAAAALSLRERREFPLVFTCGTEDWLYPRNLNFIRKMEENSIPHRFLPLAGGGHEPECFREGLWRGLDIIDSM